MLCFECAEVIKKGAGSFVFLPLGKKGKGIYTPRPQRSLKSQIAVGEKKKRYIYPHPPMNIAPKKLGETRFTALRSGESEPTTKG